jgi:hypothetical protein
MKIQDSTRKTNLFFWHQWAMLAMWLLLGASQKMQGNWFYNHFKFWIIPNSYKIKIGCAWCCQKLMNFRIEKLHWKLCSSITWLECHLKWTPCETKWGWEQNLDLVCHVPQASLVDATPPQYFENWSPKNVYFIHAWVTRNYHPPTSWNVWWCATLSSNLNASLEN